MVEQLKEFVSNGTTAIKVFMLYHDVITPGVAFTPAKSITQQTSIQM